MRRALLLAALVPLVTSCGSSPAAPTLINTPTTPPELRLISGNYTLTLAFSTSGNAVCQNNVCTSISFCIGTPAATTVKYPVVVARSGDEVLVSGGDSNNTITMTLRVSGTTVSGAISGSARDAAGIVVSLTGSVTGGPATDPAVTVFGSIDGSMSVPGGSCSNNGHGWSLTPR